MNKNNLQAEMVRKGYTYVTMAEALGLSKNGFWRKMNGLSDFTLSEVQNIIKLLDLDEDKVAAIFFN